MDFSLNEEQLLLQDSANKFLGDHCDVERHRRLAGAEPGSSPGYDPELWDQFAQLGWLGIPFTEDLGGIGGGPVEVMVMGEALGRCPVREPYLVTVITCGGLLRQLGNSAQQARYIPGIIDGSNQWAFAFAESTSGYSLSALSCAAEACGDGFRLDGSKIAVLNGHCADYLLVTARGAGQGDDEVSLFVVDSRLPGVSREPFTAVDGSRGASVHFEAVEVGPECLLGHAGGALPGIEAALDESILAMGGEALGAMQVLLDTTVEYTRTREQFGQAISKFQALQHRMADMYLKVEETRSLLFNAAIALEQGGDGAAMACSALKVKIAEAGRLVSQQAVQLHGGIGMTDELVVGHHFKRLLLLSKLYGDEAYHLRRYTDLSQAGQELAAS